MKGMPSFHHEMKFSPRPPSITKPNSNIVNPRNFFAPNSKNPSPVNKPQNKPKAFLFPSSRLPSKGNQPNHFFLAIPTKNELIQKGRENPHLIQYVMKEMKVPTNTFQDFENYINSITNPNLLRNIGMLFNQASKLSSDGKFDESPINAFVLPLPQEIEFPYLDVRYSKVGNGKPIILQHVIPNNNYFFKLPQVACGNRIILQSFLANVNPPVRNWPATLTLYVNDILVKPQYPIFNSLIDLSNFEQLKSIRFSCHNEKNSFYFVVREASFRTFEEIVQDIYNAPQANEVFRENELSLLCPITGQLMKEPGKGRNCSHTQSFDLLNFFKISAYQRNTSCPICKQNLDFSDLIYSHQTKKKLDMFKSLNIPETNYFNESCDAFDFDFVPTFTENE